MEILLQDLRYGIRMLRTKPSFTVIVVLALAIGSAANTAIFSVVNAILLRPLPYKNADRISMIWMDNPKLVVTDWHSYPNYIDFKEQNQSYEDMAAFNDRSFQSNRYRRPGSSCRVWTTASMFSVLALSLPGHAFSEAEEEPGKDLVVVLSDGFGEDDLAATPL